MRKLASIQRILSLDPIQNADAIEIASVLGWKIVVKKGDFKVGDLCVYCEIDCIMPDRPEFEFLKPRGMRIRTIRLRGQVSQGICFPLSILPANITIEEGLDVTEILGVIKYEPPIPASLHGIMKGRFPSIIPKTDETRVQVLQEVLNKYKGEKCYITEKVDGTSVTYYIKDGNFGVCTRNMEILEAEENSIWKFAREFDIENKLKSLNGNFAIQGEMVGEGIQSNKLKIKGQTVLFFNVFDIDKYEYLSFEKFSQTIGNLGLKTVPIIETNYILTDKMEELITRSIRKSLIAPDAWAEGIVIRTIQEKNDSLLASETSIKGRISFKVVNPEFLLKYGE